MSAMTDYLENKLVDFLMRGQAFTPPTSVYVALFTVAPTDAGGGTEVSGGSYARVQVPCSITDWCGTQAAGSTTASSGTSGTISNNNVLTFPTPSANWGTVVSVALFDAASGGNMLIQGALQASQVVNTGNTVSFAAGTLQFQIDN
jgi:hypothetical protein